MPSLPRPRRPAAVGDEWRPRATSLAIASVAVAVLVGVAGVLLGRPDLPVSLGTAAGLAATGVALLDRERFVHLLFGHGLVAWFGWPLGLLVVAALVSGRIDVAVGGFAVALLGLAATWVDAGDRQSLRRMRDASVRTYVGLVVWLGIAIVLAALAQSLQFVLSAVVGAGGPVRSTLGFLLVVAATGAAVLLALVWLPIRQLSPRHRRDAVERRLDLARRLAGGTVLLSIGLCGLVVLAWYLGAVDGLRVAPPPVLAALEALSSRLVVGPLVAVAVVCSVLAVIARSARRFVTATDPTSVRRLAGFLAALPLAVAAVVLVVAYLPSPTTHLLIYTFVLLIVVPAVVVLVPAVLYAVARLGILPDRTGGAALASAGLLVAGVGFAAGRPVVTFACAAVALLVWDVSTYGLGVTAELGHRPDTRRLELLHGVLSVGVAVAVVAVATGLEFVRTAAFADVGGTVPVLLACLGAILLVAPLRG